MEVFGPLPTLRDPVLIAAFEGWNDGAGSATAVVSHLAREWRARTVAELDPEAYYDFQVNRPIIRIESQGVRSISWPTTRISAVELPDSSHDMLLVQGIEPSMRWRTFSSEILGLAAELGCETIIALGALLAATPHTRPVPITGFASDPDLAEEYGFDPTAYEGPTGIVGVLQNAAQRAGFHALSLWAAVPYYAAEPPCPKATLALLSTVEDLVDITVPLGDLEEKARAWQRGAEDLAAEDDEVAEYVRQLEEAQDAAELPEASGESIAREFQRYLRHRDT
ncbi:MAG TPA: carboxylate--amine ligase [Actinobacteria bacterium]|nr:carboxylate--amine ligase [Actinomycetota bacterium]